MRLPVINRIFSLQTVNAANEVLKFTKPKFRHDLAHFLSNKSKHVDYMIRYAGKFFTQFRVLRRDPNRTRIKMTLAHHDASHGD